MAAILFRMSDAPARPDSETRRLLEPRRLLVQVVFWVIGLGLLIWLIIRAVETGDWSRLRTAEPHLIAMLVGATVVSTLLNGVTFWISIRSVRRVGLMDMQAINLLGNLLNYAPIRAGAIARVLYHHRVDQLGLLQIGAWFGFIGYILVLGVASCLTATLIHDAFDWIWFALVIGQMVFGALTLQAVAGVKLIVRHGRGIHRMARDHIALWSLVVLRLADIAMFTVRMAAALWILGIELPMTHIVALAMVALAASLIPFGRVGFREFCVAAAGARLGTLSIEGEVPWEQLALVESAGEAVVFIVGGSLAFFWVRRRWREAGAQD